MVGLAASGALRLGTLQVRGGALAPLFLDYAATAVNSATLGSCAISTSVQ